MKMMNCSLEEDVAASSATPPTSSRLLLMPEAPRHLRPKGREMSPGGRRSSLEEEEEDGGDGAEGGTRNLPASSSTSATTRSFLMGGKLNLRQRMRERFSSPSPASRKKVDEGASGGDRSPARKASQGVRAKVASVLIHPITRRASSAAAPSVYRVEQTGATTKTRKKGRKEVDLMPTPFGATQQSVDVREVKERVVTEMQQVNIKGGELLALNLKENRKKTWFAFGHMNDPKPTLMHEAYRNFLGTF